MATITERLDQVRAAIDAILTTGQAIREADGRQLTHADLGELRRLEAEYASAAARGARGARSRVRYIVPE